MYIFIIQYTDSVFENRMLRRIFGPKREVVTERWRKLYNEEVHNLQYSLPHIIRVIKSRRMRLAEQVARMGVMRSECTILVGKPEAKRLLEKPRVRWENNIPLT
jgi:choline kinase